MLTRKTYLYLSQHFWISSAFCILPFEWDKKTHRLSTFKSKGKLFMWYVNNLISTLNTSWLWKCIITGVIRGDRHVSYLAVDVLIGIVYFCQILWQGGFIFVRDDIASLLSQLIAFDKILTEKYSPREDDIEEPAPVPVLKEKESASSSEEKTKFRKPNGWQNKAKKPKVKPEKSDGCDVNIFASTYMMFVYCSMYVSIYLRNPDNDRFMFASLVKYGLQWDEATREKYYAVYMWAVMEYFQLLKFCVCFNQIFYVIILYAHPTNFWLTHLSHQATKTGPEGISEAREVIEVEDVSEAIRNYKAAEVLNLQFNECCAWFVVPIFKGLNITLHVVATYVTITFHNDIPISGFLIYPIGFVMWCSIESDVYPLLGKIDELSRNYLITWGPEGGTLFSRHFKSLFPLGVKVSNAYTIDKSTVLSVWSVVFNLVINCILF